MPEHWRAHRGLIAGLARTAKFATTIGTVLLFPLMFTAGVWLPVALMPGLVADLIVVTAWTVLLGSAATRFFRWE